MHQMQLVMLGTLLLQLLSLIMQLLLLQLLSLIIQLFSAEHLVGVHVAHHDRCRHRHRRWHLRWYRRSSVHIVTVRTAAIVTRKCSRSGRIRSRRGQENALTIAFQVTDVDVIIRER